MLSNLLALLFLLKIERLFCFHFLSLSNSVKKWSIYFACT